MIKRLTHILLFGFIATLSLQSQVNYKSYKVEVGLLAGEVLEYKAGVLMPYIEPKWNITNRITTGLRIEFVSIFQTDFQRGKLPSAYYNDLESDGSVYSLALAGDYYLNEKRLRPFVGGGTGLYYISNRQRNTYLNIDHNFYSLGFFPRIGFSIDNFRFSTEYNVIPNTEINLNYITFKVGYEIGGGKKLF